MFRERMPMNLQLFAADGAGGEASGGTGTDGNAQPPAGSQNSQPPAIDYAKIQQMLDGTLAAKEDTALKAYFKQQGMSEDDMKQAIAAFKQQKAANQPDVAGLQNQITQVQQQAAQAQAALQKAQIENAATMEALALGLDTKTIPYVLKMADLSQVVGTDGKINSEAVKTALNRVLEDVPALKPQAARQTGFIQIGASGSGTGNQQQADAAALKAAFGL